MAAAPCKECGIRPKAPGRHRCLTCQLRLEPIGEQVAAAARRLAMVPEPMRRKRTATIMRLAPVGTAWCASCQSFRDDVDFGKGATTCRACSSAKSHGAMIAKTYGVSSDDYDAMLKLQGGRCAICRAKPKSKRLAIDHDHKTGANRGLLCSRCNHDLMGAAWDSMAMASALWHYMNTPPATGAWVPPEEQAPLTPDDGNAQRPSNGLGSSDGLVTTHSGKASGAPSGPRSGAVSASADGCERPHVLPAGSQSVPGKRGVWRVWVEPDGEPPF
jgi:Recombination endonuclease VII